MALFDPSPTQPLKTHRVAETPSVPTTTKGVSPQFVLAWIFVIGFVAWTILDISHDDWSDGVVYRTFLSGILVVVGVITMARLMTKEGRRRFKVIANRFGTTPPQVNGAIFAGTEIGHVPLAYKPVDFIFCRFTKDHNAQLFEYGTERILLDIPLSAITDVSVEVISWTLSPPYKYGVNISWDSESEHEVTISFYTPKSKQFANHFAVECKRRSGLH